MIEKKKWCNKERYINGIVKEEGWKERNASKFAKIKVIHREKEREMCREVKCMLENNELEKRKRIIEQKYNSTSKKSF